MMIDVNKRLMDQVRASFAEPRPYRENRQSVAPTVIAEIVRETPSDQLPAVLADLIEWGFIKVDGNPRD